MEKQKTKNTSYPDDYAGAVGWGRGDTRVEGGGWASLRSPTCSYHHHPTELDTQLSPQGNAVLTIWREPLIHKFESRD